MTTKKATANTSKKNNKRKLSPPSKKEQEQITKTMKEHIMLTQIADDSVPFLLPSEKENTIINMDNTVIDLQNSPPTSPLTKN